MKKIKNILKHFVVPEIILVALLLLFLMPLLIEDGAWGVYFFILLTICLSILNLIISTIFSFIKLPKILTIVVIVLFSSILCLLFYVDRTRPFSEDSFIGHNMTGIIMALGVLIIHLLVSLYYIIKDKNN
jgi:hypothetical protein